MAQGFTSTGRTLVRDPISKLTDDLLLEILSRVPYKSTRRCKCVSTRWRDLIAHPDSRKKMPHTLAGFFNETYIPDRSPQWVRYYTDISEGAYPRLDLPLLPLVLQECEKLFLSDSCNGLLLLRGWDPLYLEKLDYVVCNPITEKWVAVPASVWSDRATVAFLGFDPAVSSHFHVFEFIPACVWDAEPKNGGGAKGLGIYSSKTGAWTHRCAWDSPITLSCLSRSAFLNGVLYLSSVEDLVVAVDVKGNSRVIPIPSPHSAGDVHSVYVSQGQLHFAYEGVSAMSIWVLEDPTSDNWTLKREFSQLQLLGNEYSSFLWNYDVASIHPEHNMIFIVRISMNAQSPRTLLSYDMDSGERRFIGRQECMVATTYLPLVPLFTESLANGH